MSSSCTPNSSSDHRAGRRKAVEGECATRAVALWPRLDRKRLGRCHDDPRRIAGVVAHRTSLPYESILKLLADRALSGVPAIEHVAHGNG